MADDTRRFVLLTHATKPATLAVQTADAEYELPRVGGPLTLEEVESMGWSVGASVPAGDVLAYVSGWKPGATIPERRRGDAGERPARCHAHKDGDCFWAQCPQNAGGEPGKTGRSCPLPWYGDDEE